MKKLLPILGFFLLTIGVQAQIETITIDDLADTSQLTRLAGIDHDGSLIAVEAICFDSAGCLWIRDTFGLKRAKMVVDSSVITINIYQKTTKKIVKVINIKKRFIRIINVRRFIWVFNQYICAKVFIDGIGIVHLYGDTTNGDSAIIVIHDPEKCKITVASSKTDISIMTELTPDGVRQTVMDTNGNRIITYSEPGSCTVARGADKNGIGTVEVYDSTGVTKAVADTSGKAIYERVDMEECTTTRGSNGSPITVTEGMDSTTQTTTVQDTNGNGIATIYDPEDQSMCITSTDPTGCVDVKISGNLVVTKQIQANAIQAPIKDFKIDHPLDPENKFLIHSCIEGPERYNLYYGTVTTDQKGFAVIEMPEYFMALNRDFQYQLTVLGQSFARAIIWEEMNRDGVFKIRTNEPDVKVSWQITGIRQDKDANENPLHVEISKEEYNKLRETGSN